MLRRSRQPDWTDKLILDKDGKIVANLANVILILREAPKWKGVLGYDEFNARVVIRQRPPWGQEAPQFAWTDHHESLTWVWFQSERINPSAGDSFGRYRRQPGTLPSTRCARILTRSCGMAFLAMIRG